MEVDVEEKRRLPLALRFNKTRRIIEINDETMLNHGHLQERKQIEALMRSFNPSIHAIINNEQLDLIKQLKELSDIPSTLQTIKEDVQFLKERYLSAKTPKKQLKITNEEAVLNIQDKLINRRKKV